MKFSPDCVASLKLIAGVPESKRDKTRGEEEVKPIHVSVSAELSFVATLFPNEDLSSRNELLSVKVGLLDDVCLIIWPNAIGIQNPPAPR